MLPRGIVCAAGCGLALSVLGAAAAVAAVGVPKPSGGVGTLLMQVHSVYEAERTLHRRGYYDVRLERPTLPYSFNACKRGVRYHIHVDDYGDLVQVDPIGRCYSDYGDYGYEGRRRYYGYDYSRGYYSRYPHRY